MGKDNKEEDREEKEGAAQTGGEPAGARPARARLSPVVLVVGAVIVLLILAQVVWIVNELKSQQKGSRYGLQAPGSGTAGGTLPPPSPPRMPGGTSYEGKDFPGKASPPRMPPEGQPPPSGGQNRPPDGTRNMGALDMKTPVGLYLLAGSKDPALKLSKEQAAKICDALERSLLGDSIRLLVDAELISIFTKPQLEAMTGKVPDNAAPKAADVKAALESLKTRLGDKAPSKIQISMMPPPPPEKDMIFPALSQVARAVPTMELKTDQMIRLYSLFSLTQRYMVFDGPFGDLTKVLRPGQLQFLRNLDEEAYKSESVPYPEGDMNRCRQLFLFELRDRLQQAGSP